MLISSSNYLSPINIFSKTDKQLRRMCVNHWKRLKKLTAKQIKNDIEIPSAVNCAFCVRYASFDAIISHYNPNQQSPYCINCPVRKKTGKIRCIDTPYREAADYYFDAQLRPKTIEKIKLIQKEFPPLCQKVIDYLEDLKC